MISPLVRKPWRTKTRTVEVEGAGRGLTTKVRATTILISKAELEADA